MNKKTEKQVLITFIANVDDFLKSSINSINHEFIDHYLVNDYVVKNISTTNYPFNNSHILMTVLFEKIS